MRVADFCTFQYKVSKYYRMKIAQALLDRLTEQAKASPRLRMNLDLRNSEEDTSQRMLNAIMKVLTLATGGTKE